MGLENISACLHRCCFAFRFLQSCLIQMKLRLIDSLVRKLSKLTELLNTHTEFVNSCLEVISLLKIPQFITGQKKKNSKNDRRLTEKKRTTTTAAKEMKTEIATGRSSLIRTWSTF